jgi:hypothetical protein
LRTHLTPPWNQGVLRNRDVRKGALPQRGLSFRDLQSDSFSPPSPRRSSRVAAPHVLPSLASAGALSARHERASPRSFREIDYFGRRKFFSLPEGGDGRPRSGSRQPAAGSPPRRARTIPRRFTSNPRRNDSDPERFSSVLPRLTSAPPRCRSVLPQNGSSPPRLTSHPLATGTAPLRLGTPPRRIGAGLGQFGRDPLPAPWLLSLLGAISAVGASPTWSIPTRRSAGDRQRGQEGARPVRGAP